MTKDWSYYKDKHIENQIQSLLGWFERIEKSTMSPIESIACLYLRDFANLNFGPLELEVIPQCKLGPYTVDFLVKYDRCDLHIIVECDGHEFHEKTKKQAAHDKKRDRYFTKQGYYVLRYTGSQICDNPDEMIRDIEEIVIAAQNRAV